MISLDDHLMTIDTTTTDPLPDLRPSAQPISVGAIRAAADAASRKKLSPSPGGEGRGEGDLAAPLGAVLTGQQSALVDEIKTYHAGVRKSFEHQVQYAFMAGLKLQALKETCDHGNAKNGEGFMAICQRFLPDVSPAAARRYKEFFNLCAEKLPTVSNIRSSNLALENGELPEKEKKRVLGAVFEAADGKSWTAFYRDLSFIREPKDRGRKPGETPKKLSLSEQAALRQQQAREDWQSIDLGLFTYADKFTCLADDDVTAQIARLEQALNARKAWLKQPRNQRDPKAIEKLFA